MRKSKSVKEEISASGFTFVRGSDNVFSDLGCSEAQAVNLLFRSELMIAVENALKERGLTQSQAAKLFGVGQPRVSDLYHGKIERFTIDMLVKWLVKLGKQVSIKVEN